MGRVSDDRDAPASAWWAARHVRLPVLLVCLGGAIVGLLGGRTDLLSSIGIEAGGGAGAAPTWCVPGQLPAPAGVAFEELLELRAGVAAATPRLGRRYAGGILAPEDMWSDDDPQRLLAGRSSDGNWPAGYELRWWTPDYNAVASVLMFAGTRQARAFFELASSTRCHRDGRLHSASFPPRARGLAWVNPDDAPQEDVYVLRGARVYRVSAVRLVHTPAVATLTDFEFAEALACRLPAAGCATTPLSV
jgi:hypothetical protein